MSLAALLALVTEQIKGIIESRLSNVDILTFVYGRVKWGFFTNIYVGLVLVGQGAVAVLGQPPIYFGTVALSAAKDLSFLNERSFVAFRITGLTQSAL